MIKSFKLISVFLLIAVNTVYSQNTDDDAVLMIINNHNVTKGEFVRIYKKNNTKDNVIDTKSLKDYLELFINFKLKVLEAQSLGLDTLHTFRNELAGYRKQLANPYLTDKEVEEKLLKEAYERKKVAVRASHILIKVPENASPADTLAAYNKTLEIQKKIQAGSDFSKLAMEFSDDEATKNNGGDISYFSAFSTVYPFENMAYKLKEGEISPPLRTSFGYHIIKVTGHKPNPGEVKVAHIMALVPRDASQEDVKKGEEKIKDIYAKIKAGEDFAKIATEQSDDKSSARKGGELPWFGVGRMVPEFETASFALKNDGEISEPIRTAFGWHIIKRIETKPVGSYDELKSELTTKISKDARSSQSRSSLVEKLKKEYNYKIFSKQFDELKKSVDTSLFSGTWNAQKASAQNKVLFSLGDSAYSQKSFATYLESYCKRTRSDKKSPDFLNEYLAKALNKFTEEKVVAYEEARLNSKYPQFRYLMNEYHDGILLFDLTDKMVWSKAVKDSAGLAAFYEKHKNNYMWETRADISVFNYSNDKVKDETIKLFNKIGQKNYSNNDILKIINAKDSTNLKLAESKLYLQGENETVDKLAFGNTVQNYSFNVNPEKKQIMLLNKIVEPKVKTLQEAKGLVTADYQSELEKAWIEELRSKYKVTINESVFSSIK